MSRTQSRSLLALAGFGLATAAAARYAGRHRRNRDNDAWYRQLEKPSFAPPDEVYPVVWTSLYALMAWSGWRVWSTAPSRERRHALYLWLSQLSMNARWSKLFFGEHKPMLALADGIALEGAIASYITAAQKVDRAAANAYIPYAVWVAFAAVLNLEIARLNPHES